jgi:two-component system, LytTR family, response regulator
MMFQSKGPREPIRTLIADDEPVARRGVRLLLERESGIEIVGEASGGLEAADLILRLRPDLVFLDVQMVGCDGFETLRRVGPEARPVVVFVTAYDEYALRAFEFNAVDYLLKPYDDARFAAALERARELVQRKAQRRRRQPAHPPDRAPGGRGQGPDPA